jgi:hypothetical protein
MPKLIITSAELLGGLGATWRKLGDYLKGGIPSRGGPGFGSSLIFVSLKSEVEELSQAGCAQALENAQTDYQNNIMTEVNQAISCAQKSAVDAVGDIINTEIPYIQESIEIINRQSLLMIAIATAILSNTTYNATEIIQQLTNQVNDLAARLSEGSIDGIQLEEFRRFLKALITAFEQINTELASAAPLAT